METRKSTEWRLMWWCFMALKYLCRFFSIKDVCVAIGCRMTVWQGSCQVKCVQRKSCGGMTEGWVIVQISSVVLVFRLVWSRNCSRFVIRPLSSTEIQENLLHNVLGEVEILSEGWFWWLIRGRMRSLEVLRATINSSQGVCLSWFVYGCCWLAFHEKVPWLLGTSKNCNNPLKLRNESYKKRLWFFVRLLK